MARSTSFWLMEVVCFLSFLICSLLFSCALSSTPQFDAIYQFGDSIADTGNDIRETPSGGHSGCGRPFYGQTFFRHPTGRCSDGRLMIDFFAQALNLPFLDPYLNKEGNFTHGVNFAVSGATALNVSTLASKGIAGGITKSSLMVQLDWFKSHLNAICSSPSECKQRLDKALFLVGEIGGNDYNAAAFEGKSMEVLRNLVPDVVQIIMNVVKEVIGLGAKRIVVPGNFPVGCMTIYLARFGTKDPTMYDELHCLKSWNDFAAVHNDQLQTAIKDLQKEHPDVAIVYADYFTAMRLILRDASSQGEAGVASIFRVGIERNIVGEGRQIFKPPASQGLNQHYEYVPYIITVSNGMESFDKDVLLKACCGKGDNEYNFGTMMCGSDGAPSCPNPDKHVSWDGIHLTEHAYQLLANSLLKNILPTTAQVN